jgi:hypothetical protein
MLAIFYASFSTRRTYIGALSFRGDRPATARLRRLRQPPRISQRHNAKDEKNCHSCKSNHAEKIGHSFPPAKGKGHCCETTGSLKVQ